MTQAIPDGLIATLITQWQEGMRQPALARAASVACGREIRGSTVRGWIVKQLGGLEAFQAAAAVREEAHPRPRLVAPSRAPRAPLTPPDDTAVRTIPATPLEAGWQCQMLRIRDRMEDVLVAPDGTRFLRAGPQERADLIVDLSRKLLGKVRWRFEATSGKAQRARRVERKILRAAKVRAAQSTKRVRRKPQGA